MARFNIACLIIFIFKFACTVNGKNIKPECDVPIIEAKKGEGVDGNYLVQLNSDVKSDDCDKLVADVEKAGATIQRRWSQKSNDASGFHAIHIHVNQTTKTPVLQMLKKNCKVNRIEQDQIAKAEAAACTTQGNAGWCLAKVSRLNNQYSYLKNNCGAGSKIYLIGKLCRSHKYMLFDLIYITDTGCNKTHPDLKDRVVEQQNFVTGEDKNDFNDYHGHGTATASNAGGIQYGTAKQAQLICVKALNKAGSGTYRFLTSMMILLANNELFSDIIAAINWVAEKTDKGIVNLSLGGPYSLILNNAVDSLIEKGHPAVVAAGNSNVNASTVSPASVPRAITVAASDSNNNMASFSNYGASVDIVAPGVNCLAASAQGASQFSGTSLAAPFTAGIAA
ncbi:hypothetical protein B4U80_09797, partial [Leptotrombidium deliense]